MSFSEYKKLPASQLKQIFNIEIVTEQNLFVEFTQSDNDYSSLQRTVKKMLSRINLSQSDNEATRSSLLVSHILWAASVQYQLGLFFEPQVDIS
ncbi:MAG: hypothetical protein GQ569_03990, partial [Methylococcaceae bacterium]|nr:hypothetical protein [Methylococcaceae bacterium]